LHTTDYGYYKTTGGAAATVVGVDSLYILSGLFASSVYKQEATFLEDYTNQKVSAVPYAWRQWDSTLEVLKNICISLGMVARITVDASNERQLNFIEVGQAITGGSFAVDLCIKGAELTPYVRAIEGVQVSVASGSTVKRGTLSSKSINVNCIFSSCNNTRVQPVHIGQVPQTHLQLGEDVSSALYISTVAATGSRGSVDGDALDLSEIHSLSFIVPKVDDVPAPDTAFIEDYGAYQSSAPFAYNGVMYPALAGVYSDWVEVPGMAVAHIYFTNKSGATDIGIYRPKGQSLKVKLRPITASIYYPGDTINLTIAGVGTDWSVVKYSEDWKDDVMEFEVERFDV
jgi:hypothetical protein